MLLYQWYDFLHVDDNKKVPDKQLIVTVGQQVSAAPLCEDMTSLAPCNREEEDMSMMLHAATAMIRVHHRILIRTVDTDMVVLAIWVAQELHDEVLIDEFWLALGKGKNFH